MVLRGNPKPQGGGGEEHCRNPFMFAKNVAGLCRGTPDREIQEDNI